MLPFGVKLCRIFGNRLQQTKIIRKKFHDKKIFEVVIQKSASIQLYKVYTPMSRTLDGIERNIRRAVAAMVLSALMELRNRLFFAEKMGGHF